MFERIVLLALLFAGGSSLATAFEPCGPLVTGYGPYDYRTDKKKLEVVERFHFTSDVEGLRKGNTGPLGGDLDYTLRASPNHHRALMAMVNLGIMTRTEQPKGAHYTISCYFERAIRFAPNDGTVFMIDGIYLSRVGKKREALKALAVAESLQKDDANVQYNLGLVYLDLKDYPSARLHARRAYELGFALPGLRKSLESAGQWEGPLPAETAKPSETPAAAAPAGSTQQGEAPPAAPAAK